VLNSRENAPSSVSATAYNSPTVR